MTPEHLPRSVILLLDDEGFDAAFGGLGVSGRDAAHWRLLADAVRADVAAEPGGAVAGGQPQGVAAALLPEGGGGGSRVDFALPSLGIEPPARLRAPRHGPARRVTRVAAGIAAFAIAAMVLLLVRAPEHGDPALLVPRGVSDPAHVLAAPLDLAVAVKTSAGTARLQPDRAYAVGDTLVFQVNLPAPATVELHRAAGGSRTPVWSGSVPAGQQTLPVGYALDASDTVVTFAVHATTSTGALESSVTVHAVPHP